MRDLLAALLKQIAPYLSEAIREVLRRATDELVELSKQTSNEFDDVLVNALVEALALEKDDTSRKIDEANGDTLDN